MNLPITLFVLAVLALIGSLPFWFFRERNRAFNRSWWLTACPFWAASALLVSGLFGWPEPLIRLPVLDVVAVLLGGAAGVLIGATVGVHRRRPCLWHQDDDTPPEIVTSGPYRAVRHPFYSAFLMASAAAAAALPHTLTLLALGFALVQLSRTARREEGRILDSLHGPQYHSYLMRTGRFLPRRTA